MAPPVKQEVVDNLYQLNAKATHAAVNGVPWQTPPPPELPLLLDAAEAVMKLSLRLIEEKKKVRFWRYAYVTVCGQFAVVAVAAVWGWAR